MGSGTVFADRVELLQAPGCSCKLLKEVPVLQETARCLLVSIKDNQHRVLLEATADMALPSGHFIGRGGPGSFSTVEAGRMAPGRKGGNAWIFSRGTATVCGSFKERPLALTPGPLALRRWGMHSSRCMVTP